ncbi:MAG: cystathionine beta-synthase, partial [Chloroflexota bacterium]|nr:cystathionine beta-synthase [Chloroflexota bacterium]
MIHATVIEAIGDTPLVRLNNITRGLKPTIAAKLEMLNPGGSVKDRVGIRMIEDAERQGWLAPGGTIVEPTSGNTGTGLAIAAAVRGYKCVFVMPDKVSTEKIQLLRAYGAEVVITPTAVPRDSPESYYSVADRLTREIPGAFQPNQYFNPQNPRAHYEATGPEIWAQTGGEVDVFVTAVGTGGTISGVAKFLKERNPDVHIVGADPAGSIYTEPHNMHPYKVEGIGEDFIPGTIDLGLIDEWVTVSDRDSFLTARRLAREEGLLVGGSCGTAVWAALQVARRYDEGTTIVVLLPDTGRGYLSKQYNDDWMRENGFLSRFGAATRIRDVLAYHARELPPVIGVPQGATVAEAVELLKRYRISQLPVLRADGHDAGDGATGADGAEGGRFTPPDVHEVIGSLQERTLLDQVFRSPEVMTATVGTVMEGPFALVNEHEEVERVFPLLAS